MRTASPVKTQVLEYALQHEKVHGSCPNSRKVAEALELDQHTVKYYLWLFRQDGLVGKVKKPEKERPGEDAVYDYIMDFEGRHGQYPCINTIAKVLKRDQHTVRRHIMDMIQRGRLENKGDFYHAPENKSHRLSRSEYISKKADERLKIKEVAIAKKIIKVGDTVLIRDGRFTSYENPEGRVVRATVLSKHRRVVRLSHRLSCTYVQLAIWMRDRRVAIE